MSYIEDTIKELRDQINRRMQVISALEGLDDSIKPPPTPTNQKRSWTPARHKKFRATMKALREKKKKDAAKVK